MDAALDLYIVVDRSGSMAPLADTVVTEVNRLVAAVYGHNLGTAVTVVAFDSHDPFDVLLDRHRHDGRPVIRTDDYQPGGSTPLFDAIAATLQLASRNQRAGRGRGRVLIAIVTDGQDNASTHTALDVLGKVRRRKAAGWEFLYLGVGDVFTDAGRIGLDAAEVHPWSPTEAGTAAAFATVTATALQRHPRHPRRPHRI